MSALVTVMAIELTSVEHLFTIHQKLVVLKNFHGSIFGTTFSAVLDFGDDVAGGDHP